MPSILQEIEAEGNQALIEERESWRQMGLQLATTLASLKERLNAIL